jgi:endonuclease/exonuclease/phosphatase family metal-dependent hydrolase
MVAGFSVLGFLLFLFTVSLTSYNPEKEIILTNLPQAPVFSSDTVEILTWNIGYAGLGREMDFFYDGGKQTRTGKAKTLENLDSIASLTEFRTADFVLFQEVDKNSRRTYGIDEVSAIARQMPDYAAVYATNYSVLFVPVPLSSPLGHVESGIMTMCRYMPSQSLRYSYPSKQSWLKKLFLPRRCIILCHIPLKNGSQLVLINTHNSAFDSNGEQRNEEMSFLKTVAVNEYKNGNYVIIGGDWNQIPPLKNTLKYRDIKTEYFAPFTILPDFIPDEWSWASDGNPTNRFLDMPYVENHTKETLIDFFLISPNIEILSVKCINKKYKHSDHNPVIGKFLLKNMNINK